MAAISAHKVNVMVGRTADPKGVRAIWRACMGKLPRGFECEPVLTRFTKDVKVVLDGQPQGCVGVIGITSPSLRRFEAVALVVWPLPSAMSQFN